MGVVDELLVKSLGLTKAYDTFQSYIWLQIFMISFLDTFIIDNCIGGDKQWQGTWRVGRLRPPNMSVLIAYNRIGVDHQGKKVRVQGQREGLCSCTRTEFGLQIHFDQLRSSQGA